MNFLLDFWASFPPPFLLTGQRIILRTPRPPDWQSWRDLRERSRAFLQPWEPTWSSDALTRPAFRRRLKQYAADWQSDEGYSFLIFAAGQGEELLGGIALTNIRRGVAETGTLGYWMGQDYAGQGYMREAIPVILDFAFDKLGLHRVEAACLENNDRSRGLLLKSGFREEGHARGLLRIDGNWCDHVVFAILREDVKPETTLEIS